MDNGNSHVLRFKFSITPSDLFLGCPKFNTSAAPCEMPNVLPLSVGNFSEFARYLLKFPLTSTEKKIKHTILFGEKPTGNAGRL